MTDKEASDGGQFPSAWEDFAREEREDLRIRRWSVGIALGVHIGLGAILSVLLPLPTVGTELKPKKLTVVCVLQRFVPPVQLPPKETLPRPPERRVPVPDPRPNDPEPMVRDEPMEVELAVPSLDVFTLPEPPPVPVRGPLQVGGEVMAPVRISGPDPRYPEIARRARIEGTVVVEAIVNKQGLVEQAKVARGLGWGLDEAAVNAIQQWRFDPATLGGEPVDVFYLLRVNFSVE